MAMTSRRRISTLRGCALAFLGFLLLGGIGSTASGRRLAQSDSAGREAALGKKVMCMCGSCNMTAAGCNHPGSSFSGPCDVARAELAQVHERVASGDSDDLVLQSFVQQYGPLVLIEPPRKGFDWAVWIVPVIVPVLALLLVWIVIRRWRKHATPAVAGGAGVSADLLARIRRDSGEGRGDS